MERASTADKLITSKGKLKDMFYWQIVLIVWWNKKERTEWDPSQFGRIFLLEFFSYFKQIFFHSFFKFFYLFYFFIIFFTFF